MEEKENYFKKISLFCLRIIIGVAIIAWMIHSNYDQLITSLEGFCFIWLLFAAIFYAFHLLAGAWRWRLLLRVQNIEITYFEALSLTMQGFFFSLILPGGSLGGDVVKATFIAKKTEKGNKLAATFTILIDRIIGMISLFSLAGIAGALSYKLLEGVTGFMEFIFYALLAGCTICLLSTISIFFHRHLEKIPGVLSIIKLGDRITKGAVSNAMDAMDSFRFAWKTLIKTMLISIVLIQLMLCVVVFCIASGLGNAEHDLPPEVFVLSTTLANAAGSIPATPSGVGTRDVVMEKVFVASGLSSGEGVAIALIYTSLILVFNISGGIFFILKRK